MTLRQEHFNISKYLNNKYRRYFIKISDIYMNDENGNIMVSYYITDHRITGNMTSIEFMNSPLIHGVHPSQIYLLGIETGKWMRADINNTPISFHPMSARTTQHLH